MKAHVDSLLIRRALATVDSAYEAYRLGYVGRGIELLGIAEGFIDEVHKGEFIEDPYYSGIKEAIREAKSLASERKDWEDQYLTLQEQLDIAEGRVFIKAVKSHEPAAPETQAEDGILRCRFCGAPYAYRENLELHEKGCPKGRGY